MRRRNIQINLRLNEEEAEQLSQMVRRYGGSREAYLRSIIKGYQLCEKPDREFYDVMRDLSGIGNRINQLAAKANALGFIDAPMLKREAENWHDIQLEIRRKFLMPKKVDSGSL